MKTGIRSLLLATTAMLFVQLACTEKEPVENKPPETASPDFVGNWHRAIRPIAGIIVDTLNIILTINEDSTFSLELNQRSVKTLFSTTGEWHATDDSIYLNGSECMILDTVPDPDTLKSLPDSICSVPVPLALPEEKTEWDVQTANLTVLLSAFPINPQLVSTLPTIIPVFTLEKEE